MGDWGPQSRPPGQFVESVPDPVKTGPDCQHCPQQKASKIRAPEFSLPLAHQVESGTPPGIFASAAP